MKTVAIKDFMTNDMMALAVRIGPDVRRLEAEVIRPNMAEIDRKLGQENDPTFMAYMLVWAMNSFAAGKAAKAAK